MGGSDAKAVPSPRAVPWKKKYAINKYAIYITRASY